MPAPEPEPAAAAASAAPAGAGRDFLYRSKGVEGGRNGRLLLRMTAAGLLCMFAALALSGGNVLIGALGLAVPVFWMASRRVQHLECGVSPAGIRETWLDGRDAERARSERLHPWTSVESWIFDEDLYRDAGRRRYVEIRFRGGHRIRFRAGDGADSQESFEDFAAAFQSLAAAPGLPAAGASAAAPAGAPRQRRSFYRRPIGRAATILLCLAGLGLIFVGVTQPDSLPDTGWWQIAAVLMPGCGYMAWRSFRRE